MKIIGNPKPWIGNDLGTSGEPSEHEKHMRKVHNCDHTPTKRSFGPHNQLTAECEECGALLEAREIDQNQLKKTGEIHVTTWEVTEP